MGKVTLERAKEIVEVLASEFDVNAPTVTWSEPRRNSYYFTSTQVIRLGGRDWMSDHQSNESAVLHEFAHHLSHLRGGRNHNAMFWQSLADVVKAWYGDEAAHKYPWQREYKTGQGYASRNGLTLREN